MTFAADHPSEEQLERYILRQLSADEEETIEQHYLICGPCQERLAQLDTPDLHEMVAALRSIKADSAHVTRPAAVVALRCVPIRALRPARPNMNWIAAAAAVIILCGAVATLRFVTTHPSAHITRIASEIRPRAAAPKVAADRPSAFRAARPRTANIGVRSRRSLRPIPQVRFVAYRLFCPPAALESVIEQPVIDMDLQLILVAEMEDPLQFDTFPEILEGPKRSPLRRFFAAIARPFRHILSEPN